MEELIDQLRARRQTIGNPLARSHQREQVAQSSRILLQQYEVRAPATDRFDKRQTSGQREIRVRLIRGSDAKTRQKLLQTAAPLWLQRRHPRTVQHPLQRGPGTGRFSEPQLIQHRFAQRGEGDAGIRFRRSVMICRDRCRLSNQVIEEFGHLPARL